MAKLKNKKKALSERITSKRNVQGSKKTLNPFEVHINKEKMRVLGKKLKNERGLPGISKARALKKRKFTLLQEYKVQNKTNKFNDRRIGERNIGMTEEDRAMARYAAIRAKTHNRKSIFNLADDEILTHHGQTLSEIEKFDDPRSDDEDSVDGLDSSGKLDSSFVKDAHFGGGMLKKTGGDGAMSHKDLIEQLIIESKKRKAEKQQLKERTLELTEKLDTEWKDLIPIVNKNIKDKTNQDLQQNADDYDKVIKELKFEARGHPSDRLKTEDEIAKEEMARLEDLEKERLDRMKGFTKNKSHTSHRSADDLDDNFVYDTEPEVTLTYDYEGKSNILVDAEKPIEDTETHDDSNIEEDENEADDNDDDDGSTSEDDLSDLKVSSSESDEEINEDVELKNDSVPVISESCSKEYENIQQSNSDQNEDHRISKNLLSDLKARKEIMEQARQELPYTFKLPNSYEQLQTVFHNQSATHQGIILERMIKCNHPSLAEDNKEKLSLLFVYLLQHINDISTDLQGQESVKTCFKIFDVIVPYMFDLAQFNQQNSYNSVCEVIKEKENDFRSNKKIYPNIDVLLFLKLVSCLFPTSDFRHRVVTPCFVFMEQMLSKCKVLTKKDITYGLFLSTLVLEYTTLSQRYQPAAINFLNGILHMAVPKTGIQLLKILPPFKSTSNTLVLLNNFELINFPLKLDCIYLTENEIDDKFKITALYVTLKLLKEFYQQYTQLPSRCEVFIQVLDRLLLIPTGNYPQEVKEEFSNLINILERDNADRKLEYIVMEKKKPKALRLYEPNIVKVHDGKKHRMMSKEKAERAKLLHKIKKEHKGALREIRRDKSFLGRIKIKEQLQSDKERKEKVKRIFAEASVQQSELNSLDRKKKRK